MDAKLEVYNGIVGYWPYNEYDELPFVELTYYNPDVSMKTYEKWFKEGYI